MSYRKSAPHFFSVFNVKPLVASVAVCCFGFALPASAVQDKLYLLSQVGLLDANVEQAPASFDRTCNGWILGGGVRFTDWLATEGHVTDMQGTTVSLAGLLNVPVFGDRYGLSGKAGYQLWSGTQASNTYMVDGKRGTGPWFGAEANYNVNQRWQVLGGWQRYLYDDDTLDFLSLGLRFSLGDRNVGAILPAPEPMQSVSFGSQADAMQDDMKSEMSDTKDTMMAVVDADGDGVIDSNDLCAGTPVEFAVDPNGCTLYEEKLVGFNLQILFDQDSSDIPTKYNARIRELADFILEHDVEQVMVYGHTSASGTADYNQRLSQQRAEEMANMLNVIYGIPSDVLMPVGKGETELLDDSGSTLAERVNRRVQIALQQTVQVEKMR